MSDPQELEQSVQGLVQEICDILERHGYETVSMGAVMRLLGIQDDRARVYDRDWISLTDPQRGVISRPPDQKLH